MPDSHVNASKVDTLNLTMIKPTALEQENVSAHIFAFSYNLLVEQI